MLAWKLQCGFNDTDLVLVNWTNFNREDRIKDGCWKTGGMLPLQDSITRNLFETIGMKKMILLKTLAL